QQLRSIYKTTNGGRSREQTEVRVGQSEIVCFIRYLPKIYFQSRISDKTNICIANRTRTKTSLPRRNKLKVV
ncbi:MAG: hypothetical protein II282_02975, partial [Alistipes sp.]|nr:hypothetical protein [Alistipes sp.]